MKKKIISYFVFISFILLSSCIAEWDKSLETKTIDSEITESSEFFNKENIDIDVSKYRNKLSIKMEIDLPYDFEFPVDTTYGYQLVNTYFYFNFLIDGKPIEADKFLLDNYKKSQINKDGTVSFRSNLKNINIKNKFKIDVPMYVFHNVKNGKQKIELEIYQKHFQNTKTYNYETGNDDEPILIDDKKIWCKIEFEIDVPEIYLTKIYTDSIILIDDETFSPKGMDFSFRDGYPDIYWKLYFPCKSNRNNKSPYYKSAVEKYATSYSGKETVKLYHYGKKKKIKIGVYDKDDMSKDDVIGTWFGNIDDIRQENENYTKLSFDNVEFFKIKASKKDILVN